MRTRALLLGLVAILSGCAWLSTSRSAPLEDDRSIVFPPFFAHSAVAVGEENVLYELDGVVLRAISIAANDFLPPGDEDRPCWKKQEAYRYRAIRQGDIIFVDISEDLDFCGLQYVSVDTGARYAISTDGRILRRSMGAEPENPMGPATADAGGRRGSTPSEHSPTIPLSPEGLSRLSPPDPRDGGSSPVPPVPPVPDGGTSSLP